MPSRAVKVNPIAIIDFILTWGGERRGGERREGGEGVEAKI